MTLADHLGTADVREALRADVLAGLADRPRTLSPRWLYDERGSELFDKITRLPEYYPTEAERSILAARAGDIAAASRADTLVELGSGTSDKTRLLLSALRDGGTLSRYVPVDVDPTVLRSAGAAVAQAYAGVEVSAVCADFLAQLGELPRGGRRLVAFLGSTIGNLEPLPRRDFLASVSATLAPGDAFLLGTDLAKDPARLVAAYDDSAGVTAEFDRNVLAVLNRELAADFHVEAFEHRAVWDADNEWIEMRLRSLRVQFVRVDDLDLTLDLADGEEIRTEISAKFRREGITAELAAAGLQMTDWWTDPAGDFGLSMSVRA